MTEAKPNPEGFKKDVEECKKQAMENRMGLVKIFVVAGFCAFGVGLWFEHGDFAIFSPKETPVEQR